MQQLFEYPYVIFSIFAICCIVLGAVGVFFAATGVKTAKNHPKNAFIPIGRMEADFQKLGRRRAERTLLYINVSSDNVYDMQVEAKVLAEIQNLLLHTFADGENSDVSVYGERNFVVLTTWQTEDVWAYIESFQETLNRCLLDYGVLNIVNVRTGLFFAVGSQLRFDEAINRAKQACVIAKQENMSCVEWNVTSSKALEEKIKRENSIEKEIDNNRFFLEYQPILDGKTRKIIGAEVLSRLNSETDGVLSPGKFLSAVDSVGLNDKFDYYIFEKNCKWIANNKAQREKYIYTINFSRTTLCAPGFAENIIAIVEKYGLDFSCLAVEILEDKNIEGEAQRQMLDNLMRLKEKGVIALLDDFGNGYTTFGDLYNDAVSIVKIDKTITQNAVTEKGFSILKNIIRTAGDVGAKTLCEGVETQEEEDAVMRAGCDFLQGFFYYRPVPVATLEKLFEDMAD